MSYGVPASAKEALARHLRAWVEANCHGSQSEASRRLGISQPHVSNLLHPERNKWVGIDVLLLLREKLAISLDELLGLPPLSTVAPPHHLDSDAARRVLQFLTSDAMRALMAAADGATPPQPSGAGEQAEVARKGRGDS